MFRTYSGAPVSIRDTNGDDVAFSTFSVPDRARVVIQTENSAPVLDKVNDIPCSYQILDSSGNIWLEKTGIIRGRGNSTWDMPKKPYKVKFDEKSYVLGMPKSKKWALLANYVDPSRIRNAMVYWMAQFIGIPWSPRSRVMDVYLNGVYQGLYQFIETVEIEKTRVNIDNVEEATSGVELTGGYIMEVDVRLEQNSEIGWRTRLNIPIIFDEPDGDVSEQYDYMKNLTQSAEDALFSESFPNNNWQQYFDVDSWIQWYLLTELVCNNDAGFGASVKITKKRGDDKLYLGPPWDYDASFGVTFFINHPTNTWWVRVGATWIARMLEDPSFVSTMRDRWNSFKSNLVKAGAVNHAQVLTDSIAVMLSDDLAAWPDSPSAPDLAAFLQNRINWMDGELNLEAGMSDTTPPDIPTGFTVQSFTSTTATLTWNDPGANSGLGVVGYRIRDISDNHIIAMTRYPYDDGDVSVNLLNRAVVNGLEPDTEYNFILECRDAPGNWSDPTDSIQVTTSA